MGISTRSSHKVRPTVMRRLALAIAVAGMLGLFALNVEQARGDSLAALDFDGVNDYVAMGAAPGLGATQFTIEAWIRRDTGGATASTGTGGVTALPIISKGRNEADGSNVDANYFLGITTGGFLSADFEDAATGANHPVTATTDAIAVSATWNHVAATYGAGTWNIYLNGALVITESESGAVPRSDSVQHAAIGAALNSTGVPNGAFSGAIDEARIWNVARTQAQIMASKNAEIVSAAGLIGRWGMNEGTGTAVADSSGGGNNGTSSGTAPLALWFSPGAPITSPASPSCTACAVDFDGVSDHVTFGAAPALGASQFTLEAWVRRDGFGDSADTGTLGLTGVDVAIPILSKGRAQSENSTVDMNYFLGLRASDFRLVADFEEGAGQPSPGLNHPVIAASSPIPADGSWHHVAATYGSGVWFLYVDGAQVGTLNLGSNILPRADSIQHAGIGTSMNSTGVTDGFFNGAIDEARIWNVVRTQPQILAGLSTEITSAAGLIGRWGMNEGTGASIADSSGGGTTGTLVNGPRWVAGAPFSTAAPTSTAVPAGDPVLVGAGDISRCDTNNDELTALLLDNIEGTVFTLGDNVYQDGTATEFATCYDPTWGRHRLRTRPVAGNHDYNTANATPYYDYFNGIGQNSGPAGDRDKGYYSYDLGQYWHVVVLNSECVAAPNGIGTTGCNAGSPQETWLRADLAANAGKHVISMWHKPRYSSGVNVTITQPLWQALVDYGAEINLAGHDHHYERFSPMDGAGASDPACGMTAFVVGTGGTGFSGLGTTKPNSVVRNNTTFGVMKFTLHQSSYDWEFVPITGSTFTDSGTAATNSCGIGATPTPSPTTVPSSTPTATPTATTAPTQTPTSTPTVTATATTAPTETPTNTPTVTATATTAPTETPTNTATATPTPTATPSPTDTPTSTSTPTATASPTATATATPTPEPDSDGDGYSDARENAMGENPNLYCVTMRADVDYSGVPNSGDLLRVARAYGPHPGGSRMDQNGDNFVNSGDLGLVASQFNKLVGPTCPNS